LLQLFSLLQYNSKLQTKQTNKNTLQPFRLTVKQTKSQTCTETALALLAPAPAAMDALAALYVLFLPASDTQHVLTLASTKLMNN
jgi:hypothetical protein